MFEQTKCQDKGKKGGHFYHQDPWPSNIRSKHCLSSALVSNPITYSTYYFSSE